MLIDILSGTILKSTFIGCVENGVIRKLGILSGSN
jgi:hypothetical protein